MTKVYAVPETNEQFLGVGTADTVFMGEDAYRPEDGSIYKCEAVPPVPPATEPTMGTWVIDTAAEAERTRLEAIEAQQETVGMFDKTIAEAHTMIDDTLAVATDWVTLRTQVAILLKELVVYDMTKKAFNQLLVDKIKIK